MKLLRYGEIGKEKPGILDQEGKTTNMKYAKCLTNKEILLWINEWTTNKEIQKMSTDKNIYINIENYPGKLGVLYDDLGAGLLGLLSATIVHQITLLSFKGVALSPYLDLQSH